MPLVNLHGTAEAIEILAWLLMAEKQYQHYPALALLNTSLELLIQVQILLHLLVILASLLLASLT